MPFRLLLNRGECEELRYAPHQSLTDAYALLDYLKPSAVFLVLTVNEHFCAIRDIQLTQPDKLPERAVEIHFFKNYRHHSVTPPL